MRKRSGPSQKSGGSLEGCSLNRIGKPANFLINAIFTVCSAICILPFLFVLMISVTSEQSLQKFGYHFIPNEFSLDAYRFLAHEADTIIHALGVSVFVTITGTLIGLALTTGMGYVLSQYDYKMKKFFTWVVFIPMVFNGGMVANYVVNVNVLRLKDTVWVLILPLAVSSFHVIICKTFFRSTIPDSIVESALIDGASQYVIFSKIVLPISRPVLATIGLFLTFGYWNDWFQSSLYITNKSWISMQALLDGILKNIQYIATNPSAGVSLQQYKNRMPSESVRMAMAVMIIVPIACAYPFFQRYFISGLTIGAVKG